MSVILLTNHDENIYDIFKTNVEVPKTYKPRPRKSTEISAKTDDYVPTKKYGVMGVAEMEPPDPHNFLKKRTGQLCYVKDDGTIKRPTCPKSSMPTTKQLLEMYNPKKGEKDHVVQNIKKIKGAPAVEPTPKLVFDVKGTKTLLKDIEPHYIHGPYFGQTPHYLKKFIALREKEYQLKKDVSGASQPLCKYITRDKRKALLKGLKQNWEELQQQFQGLPILTDTTPKIIRKSKLEKQLKQLERDIVLLERHPYIYVYDDDKIQ